MANCTIIEEGGLILAVAAPAEAKAVLGAFSTNKALAEQPWVLHRVSVAVEVLVTGVGKANAAGALAMVVSRERHRAVVSVGVAGALPGGGLAIGHTITARRSVYADEGLITPEGFSDCGAMGFSLAPNMVDSGIDHDPGLVAALGRHTSHMGVIATVSTCSGTDAGASAVAERTGAVAEAMEGAALAQVAARLGLRSAEVRAISNTTGDRGGQVWDLEAGLTSIGRFVAAAFVR